MQNIKITADSDLTKVVDVLKRSHGTVAEEFEFTKENNPSNMAFVDCETLKKQLKKGIELFLFEEENVPIGCVAIEKSPNGTDTFYIEKVSVIPEERRKGYGEQIMKFAEARIKEKRGEKVSVALIDKNYRLKHWYEQLGYCESGVRDFPHLPFLVCFMEKKL